MTHHLEHARKAMTAIAAVLAFSSTPLLAQDTGSPEPVSDPAPEPSAPAADPLAPDAAPAETTTTTTEAAAEATAAPAKPKASKATSAARRTTSATGTATRTATRSTQPAPAADAAVPVPPPAEPLAAAPVAPGPMPVAEPAPAPEPASNPAAIDMDDALPIAGGAALGLMLLGGAAAVRRRRRRKLDEADEAVKWAFIESHAEAEPAAPEPAPQPAFVRAAPPKHDPVPAKEPIADAPTTELPEDFDLSRFGPHVQAAYRGPTTDNPSLSLKHRLRRASFLDQQERRLAEEAGAAKPAEPIPATGNWESRSDADFLFRRAAKTEKPALQH